MKVLSIGQKPFHCLPYSLGCTGEQLRATLPFYVAAVDSLPYLDEIIVVG